MEKRLNKLKEIFYQLPRLFILKVFRSFWFVPGLITVGSAFASGLLQATDGWLDFSPGESLRWLFSNSPVGARALLSTIAGSTITVTGVLLSAIVVVITLASQQYGPRLVQNFINDRIGQIVVGCFVGCFVYSVITLNSIQSGESGYVPHLSVLCALLYSIFCIGLLIFFVQHLISSIQVQSIMRRVSKSLNREIENLFPSEIAQGSPDEGHESSENPRAGNSECVLLRAQRSGYLQSLDDEELVQLAIEHGFVVYLQVNPGDFLIHDSILAEIEINSEFEEFRDSFSSCFIIGTYPTSNQDVTFPVRQLSEIAIRALSPGINDPYTAIEAIDYLTSSLGQLIGRKWPSPRRFGSDGQLRVIAQPPGFEVILRQAFQQIHHYGRSDITIAIHLLHALSTIAGDNSGVRDRIEIVENFAKEIYEKSKFSLEAEADRDRLDKAYQSCFATQR